MKLAYIAEINSNDESAPKIHLNEIAGNLNRFQNEVRVIIPRTGKFQNEKFNLKINALGFKFLPITSNYLLFEFLLFFYLPFLILFRKIDGIYTRQSSITIVPALYSKWFNLPYFTELNGNMEEEIIELGKSKFLARINNFVERYCYKIARRIIVVTPNLKKYLIKKYNVPKEKIVILENGVDENFLRPLNKKLCATKLKLDKDYSYLCYVGKFAPWQGLESLIKSFKKIQDKLPNTILLLVGDGESKESLLSLSKSLGLGDKIIFTGGVKHDLIPYYLGLSDLCLAPFTKERNKRMGSSAFKMYEYASCGKPIITTHPDFVTKNNCGLVSKEDNPNDLAKKTISLLLNEKLKKELGDDGRDAVLKKYSWKIVAEKLNEIIKEK